MLYTTYFGNLRKLPDTITPIAICGKSPDWWNGYEYKKLAPKWAFFKEWKENHDNDFYIRCFEEQVLSKLNPNKVLEDLDNLAGKGDKALVCYEKVGEFCHRHLVSAWFRENGIDIIEYSRIL